MNIEDILLNEEPENEFGRLYLTRDFVEDEIELVYETPDGDPVYLLTFRDEGNGLTAFPAGGAYLADGFNLCPVTGCLIVGEPDE